MGALYQAHDERLGSRCAVKEMLDKFDNQDALQAMIKRFGEEARSLAALNHVGIPRVRDYFNQGQACYVVMDLINGSNLEQELAERMALVGAPFPPELVVNDAIQILDILIYLHGQTPAMIHRDVKPANIIREHPSEQIQLVDFGLARSVANTGPTQTIVGTLSYAPLEQMQGRAEPRSDLYSLGATMAHLITGQAPEFLDVPKLSQAVPDIDPELAEIVERAVSQTAEGRPKDAREMRQALWDWLARRRRTQGDETRQLPSGKLEELALAKPERVASMIPPAAPLKGGPSIPAPRKPQPPTPVRKASAAPSEARAATRPTPSTASRLRWGLGAVAVLFSGLLYAGLRHPGPSATATPEPLPLRSLSPTPLPTTVPIVSPSPSSVSPTHTTGVAHPPPAKKPVPKPPAPTPHVAPKPAVPIRREPRFQPPPIHHFQPKPTYHAPPVRPTHGRPATVAPETH